MSFMDRRFARLGRTVLSDDELRVIAPSIFAETAHESRSNRYAYIPTSEIVDGLRDNGFVPVLAKQGGSRVPGKADYTKHLIRFRHAGAAAQSLAVGDTFPEVVVVNSHDGTSTYKVMAGLMRLVCLNGMIVGDRELATVTVPHKGNVADEVIEGSFRVLSESRKAVEAAEAWTGITLHPDEQQALADAAYSIRFSDAEGKVTTPIASRQLLDVRRREDVGNDLWRVSNRIQEAVIRGGLHAMGRDAEGRRRRVTSREVKSIDEDVRLNRALWALNERMAQLKAA